MEKILIVDDDITFTKILDNFLSKNGYQVKVAYGVKEAIALLDGSFDLYLLDYRLPDGVGLDIITAAQQLHLQTKAVIMTSFNDIRTAVKAMRLGVIDYITKPVNQDELLMIIKDAINKESTSGHNTGSGNVSGYFIEGISKASQKLYNEIKLIGPTDMSVIIQGESGTGKEHIARMVHDLSNRKNKKFIAIDCGTLSAEFAISELFGHVQGSFTGAHQDKSGRFVEANGGTIFLDEIGNLSMEVQVKLLRALQEKIIQPLGSNKDIKIDVRVIAATNDNLRSSIRNGTFREDLYYRLNEFKIEVPTLKNRLEDFPLFVDFFLEQSNKELHKNVKTITPEVMNVLQHYDWPGNIRELKNIIKRLVLLSKNDIADIEGLPDEMLLSIDDDTDHSSSFSSSTDLKLIQEQKEKELIAQTLISVKHNKSKAARLLNIDRTTLYYKIKKYHLED